MRRGAHFFLLPLLLLAVQGQPPSPLTSVEKIGEGIWMAQTDKGSNADWFVVGDQVVAVDTGSDARTGQALIEKIRETAGKPPAFVLITHAHGDHAGGVGPFVAAGAEVICHENAAAAVAQLVESSGGKSGLLALSERLAFFGSPRRAAIYYLGAGHSSSDLVLYLPDDKILFPGDLALGGRAPYMQSPDVDPKSWEKTLNRLAQLDVDKIVPGHGVLAKRQALADTYAYLKKINELAQMMIKEKVSEELIEARLRRPDSGIQPADITPDVVANIRGVMRAEKARAAAQPSPTAAPTSRAPAKKQS